jgi:hypothetical protein
VPIRFSQSGFLRVSPQYDPIRSSDESVFSRRYSQWRIVIRIVIKMPKQLSLFGTFVVPSGYSDRKTSDSSTPYDKFISVYVPLLNQKYPKSKKQKVYEIAQAEWRRKFREISSGNRGGGG